MYSYSSIETIEKELWEDTKSNELNEDSKNKQVAYYSMNLYLSKLSKLMSERCKQEFGWHNPQDVYDGI